MDIFFRANFLLLELESLLNMQRIKDKICMILEELKCPVIF